MPRTGLKLRIFLSVGTEQVFRQDGTIVPYNVRQKSQPFGSSLIDKRE